MLAIIAALEQEITRDGQFAIRWSRDGSFGNEIKVWRNRRQGGAVLVVSGQGQAAAKRVVDIICTRERPVAILSIGFAGALEPSLRAGDLVVGNTLRLWPQQNDKPELRPNKSLARVASKAAVAQKLPGTEGSLVTVERIVDTTEQKRTLGEQGRAVVAEMESYWLAESAQIAGIPFIAVRSVVDTVVMDLPKVLRDSKEQPSGMQVILSSLKNPGSALPLYMLWRNADKARRSLQLFTFEFLEEFAKNPVAATAGG